MRGGSGRGCSGGGRRPPPASPAATSSGSTSRSGCSRGRRCCCSTSPASASTPARAPASGGSSSPPPAAPPLGVRLRPRRPRHHRHLLHPRHPGGRALRRPPARPRRWRGALRRPACGAARGGAPGGAGGRRPRLRDRLRRLPAPPGALMRGVRWLLLKDLQILRRSPLQAVLLVAYPILIAVLVGFAISRGPEKPRVAFLNEVPAGTRITVG